MARTAAGAALTANHQGLQRALVARVLRQLLQLWPSVDPRTPSTFDLFNQAATLLVLDGYRTSAGLAAAYYAAFHLAEEMPGLVQTPVAEPPPADKVRDLLRGSAVVGILNARAAGLTAAAERDQGWVQLAGQATSLVAGGGRMTVLDGMRLDPKVRGYQRVTAHPCAFCAMLASRGPVYTRQFEAHDNCQCSIEPAYPGTTWPPRSAEYRDVWDQTTGGLSGRDAYNAFRRAIEGAPPTPTAAAA